MQDKHEQLGDHGALPGAASGPPPGSSPVKICGLEVHPLAEIFPLMSGAEFEKFVADIKIKGVLDPLWIYLGKVIDGRNRLRACERLGIVPPTREWDGK